MRKRLVFVAVVCLFCLAMAVPAVAQVQSNAADLAGVVTDPQGARIPGAQVIVRNLATNLTRSVTTDGDGAYSLLALPPGRYEVIVQASGFNTQQNPEVELSVGTRAELNFEMGLQTGQETVVVTSESILVETQRTAVTETISSNQIDNLPINQRDYLNFTLLTSSAARDSAPSIGAAPTSGLNFGGQRGRSNQVSVDGADATDNSTNGVRATVSQEAVQEFQMVTSGYMPEFGRASGAVINIVTKGGGNDLHGNVFGFIRNKKFDARNPFSTVDDPAFTRFQGGVTIGGPISQDKTFFFFSYERRQRREEGFSSIGAGNFGLIDVPLNPSLTVQVTPEQAAFLVDPIVNGAIGPINLADGFPNTPLEDYLFLAAGSSGVALNGFNPLLFGTGFEFSFPTTCVPPVCTTLPASFTSLNALRGNYPLTEDTDFISGRIDHQWNENNNFFVRASFIPSDVTGIQVNAQNQTFGQNSFSRSSEQFVDDWAIVSQNVTTGSDWVNEARGQVAGRALSYTPSSFPGGPGEALGGQGPGINIGGFAFFGREPFSRVDRTEKRFQGTDNYTFIWGNHTFKMGGDFNHIQVRPRLANNQVFELNFGSVINFGALGASTFGFPSSVGPIPVPSFTGVQAYGLGIPSSFIQGIGDSFSSFNNNTLGFYFQDSWRVNSNLTVNYGVRWDGEWTPQLPAFNAVTEASEEFLGVTEGIPRDWDNIAPRVGIAWDPWGDGKTVLRASAGLFYDHPLLAVAFNADTADGAQSTQQILFGGSPCFPATSVLSDPTCLNATNIFQGILDTSAGPAGPDPFNFGFLPNEQRFDSFQANSIFINQNFCPQPSPDPNRTCAGFPLAILPWTLPLARDFEFGYSSQWNLTFEREIANDFSISVGYLGVNGTKLNRPRNINTADPALLVSNLDVAIQSGLVPIGTDPRQVAVPVNGGVPGCFNTATGSVNVVIPAVIGLAFDVLNCGAPPVGVLGTAAAFNFFRSTGPNMAFINGIGVTDAQLAAALAGLGNPFPAGPGFFVPFSDINQQESSGSSIYHGLTLNLRKRYSNNYEFLASYTWAHAIDDSTDLQTLLNPQDNSRPDLERSNSTFDQRHRFVFSSVINSPYQWSDEGWAKKFLADFIVSPIIEANSGRPYSAFAGADVNLDFGPNTDRPSVVPAGTPGSVSSPFISGVAFAPPTVCPSTTTANTQVFGCTGNIGRNTFTRPGTWFLNLRVARKMAVGERTNLELIADMFNVFNRLNIADVNPLCDPIAGRCIAGQPTAAFDARQFQFGVKLSW